MEKEKEEKKLKNIKYHIDDFLTTGPVILEKKYTWKRFQDKYSQCIEESGKNKL
jgi:hypothetical protein